MTILDKITYYNLLIKSWKKVRSSKPKHKWSESRGSDNITIKDFNDNHDRYIKQIRQELKMKKFTFHALRPILLPKPNKDKDRLICIPTIRDRVVHRALLHIINQFAYPTINNDVSFCGIKRDTFKKQPLEDRKNIKSAIERLIQQVKAGKVWVFESDIKSFFDTVPKKQLIKKIRSLLNGDRSVDWLLKKLIDFHIIEDKFIINNPRTPFLPDPKNEIGIPQGSSLSPLFSNIYLIDFDSKMKKAYGNRYIRYADDFIVLCRTKKEATDAKRYAKTLIKKNLLKLAQKKTHITDLRKGSIIFLGLKIDKTAIKQKKDLSELKSFFNEKILNPKNKKIYRNGYKSLSRRQIIQKMNSIIRGWGEFYRYYHSEEMYITLNQMIDKRPQKGIFSQIKKLDLRRIQPVIEEKEWQNLFNKKPHSNNQK